MSLILTVDGDRWRAHLRAVADANPGLVPVAKGNGYGFGLGRLARKARRGWASTRSRSAPTTSCREVADRFAGDLLVLTPWRPFGPALDGRAAGTPGRPHRQPARATSSRPARPRARTPGSCSSGSPACAGTASTARELRGRRRRSREHPAARLEGVALHLPLAHGSHLAEVDRLLNDVVAAEPADRAPSGSAT